ncbi:arabinose efflux permease family protein [Nostoc sp. PCC 7524]|uniref:MFS transporter n=1 Tax=Nostoc sp. (strain ATCC 29411 / PCC 7524) TaxID=28072 RepID=UPI00029F4085|nr:MFS transporter [Nostoc sp. PCC 7524]AFY48011.1 arabinose efflux permease family protein [Nostoc sp. PCC 7524]
MRTFIIVWLGQLVSTIGSNMTGFAIEIWAWEITGKATTLTLVGFFSLLPSIIITPISGVIVDRCNRKLLMMVGDTVAVLSTIIILLLHITNNLQIWHFYLTGAIVGTFNQFQSLAYSSSVSLMIPKKLYTRASSLEFLSGYGSNIIAPALAGYLYTVIGFLGIWLIDICTFAVAISSLFLVSIPQPPRTTTNESVVNIWQDLGFGWCYISTHKSLLALLVVNLLFWLPHDIGDSLYSPMILSRTDNNTVVLGSLASAAGFGGVTGAIIVSTWGGFRRKIKGVLWGMMGAGISKIVFGLGRTSWVWILAQFCSSLNFPLNGSSDNAIWLAKVSPDVQGRVFAARSLLLQIGSAVGYLIAGPLADQVFTPALQSGGVLVGLLGGLFGTGTGAGIALLYVICAVCMLLVGFLGFFVPVLRNVEKILPDHDQVIV